MRGEVQKLLELFTLHDSTIEKLQLITTAKEASESEERKAARLGLDKILNLYKTIVKETNISEADRKALFEKYTLLSRAVGIISGNIVDHDR